MNFLIPSIKVNFCIQGQHVLTSNAYVRIWLGRCTFFPESSSEPALQMFRSCMKYRTLLASKFNKKKNFFQHDTRNYEIELKKSQIDILDTHIWLICYQYLLNFFYLPYSNLWNWKLNYVAILDNGMMGDKEDRLPLLQYLKLEMDAITKIWFIVTLNPQTQAGRHAVNIVWLDFDVMLMQIRFSCCYFRCLVLLIFNALQQPKRRWAHDYHHSKVWSVYGTFYRLYSQYHLCKWCLILHNANDEPWKGTY